MLYELSGKVKKVCDVETFKSGFQKRTLVVEESGENVKYPQKFAVDFVKDKAALLDQVGVGDNVTLRFAIRGSEWTDPKTNRVRYFTSLNGVSIRGGGNASRASGMPAPAVPPADIGEVLDGEQMPF